MGKRYRLEINYDEITKDNIDVAHRIKDLGIDGSTSISSDKYYAYFKTKPSSNHPNEAGIELPDKTGWLTEIKEPLSFEEWFMSSMNLPDVSKASASVCWNGCLENQKLAHNIKLDEVRKDFIKHIEINETKIVDKEVLISVLEDAFKLMEMN